MKRVMIIGNCGAGKTTLARKIHDLTQLPLVHLDQQYWQPGWVETDLEIWKQKVEEMVARDSWIIDGNYSSSMITRLKRADTVILLEVPTWKAVLRVIKRVIKHHGVCRPDMPEGCPERFDISFLHYVFIYNFTRKPKTYRILKEHGQNKQIHVLRNNRDINDFLTAIAAGKVPENVLF